jgi:hypothetical protein
LRTPSMPTVKSRPTPSRHRYGQVGWDAGNRNQQAMATRRDLDITRRPIGGEQAANALQPTSSSRYATTLDAKVRGPIEASPLITRRPCLFSHDRGHSFETCQYPNHKATEEVGLSREPRGAYSVAPCRVLSSTDDALQLPRSRRRRPTQGQRREGGFHLSRWTAARPGGSAGSTGWSPAPSPPRFGT